MVPHVENWSEVRAGEVGRNPPVASRCRVVPRNSLRNRFKHSNALIDVVREIRHSASGYHLEAWPDDASLELGEPCGF